MALSHDDCQRLDCGWIAGQVPEPLGFSVTFDLTGYTIVLQMQLPDATLVTKTAIIDTATATSSTFHVNFDASDVVEGLTRARLLFTNPSGQTTKGGEFIIEVEESWT